MAGNLGSSLMGSASHHGDTDATPYLGSGSTYKTLYATWANMFNNYHETDCGSLTCSLKAKGCSDPHSGTNIVINSNNGLDIK